MTFFRSPTILSAIDLPKGMFGPKGFGVRQALFDLLGALAVGHRSVRNCLCVYKYISYI